MFSIKINAKATLAAIYADVAQLVRDGARPEAEVGYKTDYAAYVHEEPQHMRKSGQRKYLEYPAFAQQGELSRQAYQTLMTGGSLGDMVTMVADKLLDLAQKLAPEYTGLLKSTGYAERKV